MVYRVLVTGSRHRGDHAIGYFLSLHCDGVPECASSTAAPAGWRRKPRARLSGTVSRSGSTADVRRDGKRARAVCNQAMIDLGADICLAFPREGADDTWDCIRRAVDAGIECRVYPEPKLRPPTRPRRWGPAAR